MGKVLNYMDELVKSMDDAVEDSVDKLYAYIGDRVICSRDYDLEKRRYMDLKRNNLAVPTEMEFIYTLPKHQALKFISIIREYIGSFYFPGIFTFKDYEKEKLYYHAKLDFIARKKHKKYTIPEDEIPETILESVFPDQESMDIAYGRFPKKKYVAVYIFDDFSKYKNKDEEKPKQKVKTNKKENSL